MCLKFEYGLAVQNTSNNERGEARRERWTRGEPVDNGVTLLDVWYKAEALPSVSN